MKEPRERIATYKIADIREGQGFSFQRTISKEELDAFANLSGDINPLHMDDKFAQSRGFKNRVVHGALLIAYISKMVGVYFPGENCLIQTLSLNFLAPAYINDEIEINGTVDQVSPALNVIILKVAIKNLKNNIILAEGRMQIGFTKGKE